MNKNQKANKEDLKRKELELATEAMVDAGFDSVTVEKVQKLDNEFGFIIYVAVIGNGIVIYAPTYNHTVQFVTF